MPTIIHYRPEEQQHDTAIVRLLQAAYVDAGFTAPEIAARMFRPDEVKMRGEVLLALSDETNVIGMIIVATDSNPYRQVAGSGEAEMQLLATHPASRTRGVGEALCRAFETRAVERGLSSAVLSTQPTMHAAHRLYLRMNFVRNPARDWRRNDREFWVFDKTLRV